MKLAGTGADQDKAILAAMIDEAKKRGLGTTMHHSPPGLSRGQRASRPARMGLGTVTHFYGHFESILKDGRTHPFPDDYNYNDEQSPLAPRRQGHRLHVRAAARRVVGLPERAEGQRLHLRADLDVYEAGRDLMRARNPEWHAEFTMPSIWEFWEPDRENHGSFYYDWTTSDEISWKQFYQRYMQLINDYKSIGGRVAGGHRRRLHLQPLRLRRDPRARAYAGSGLHRHEVIRAYTRDAARTLTAPKGVEPDFGMVRVGQMADLMIAPENPLANFKTLYGTGTERLNDATGKIERVGGIRWTVRNGIVYDAKQLLADVAAMVQAQKAAGGCAGIELDWSAAGPCGGPGADIPPVPTPAPTATAPDAGGRPRPARRAIRASRPGRSRGPEGRQGRRAERARHLRLCLRRRARSSARSRRPRAPRPPQGLGAAAEHQAHRHPQRQGKVTLTP